MDWIENSIKNAQQGKTKTVGDDWISNSIRQATARNTGNNFQKRLNDVYALGNTLNSNIEKHESGWASLGNSALLISDIQKYFSEAESLKNDLIANSDAYKQALGEDNYKKIQTQIDNILNTKEGTVSSHKKRAQLYGQYDTAEDYNNAKRNYQLDTKYSRLKTFEDYDKYIKSGNFEQADMPQDEKDYLLRLGYSLEYREAVSSLNAAKKRLEGLPKKITVNSPYNEQQRVKIQQEKKNLEATIKNLETRIKEMDNMGGIYTGLNTTVLSESGEYAFDERWSNKKAEMEEKTALNDKEKLKLLSGQKVDKSDYWVDEIFKNAEPYQHLYYATDDEKRMYSFIKERDGEGLAQKYLEDLKVSKLDKRLNQAIFQKMSDYSAQNGGTAILGSLASIPASVFSGLEFAAYRLGGEKFDGIRSTLATQSQGFREGTKTHWDGAWGEDVWDFLYDTGMSGVDSAAAAGLSAAVPFLGEALLGSSAAASTYNDALDRGISHGDAMLTALTAGVAESLFEHMSISKFLDAGDITKGFTKSGLRQATKTLLTEMGINFTEELFTEVSNIITDTAINGNLSNYAIAVKDYYMQGMSPEEAKEKALGDFKNQILEAGLSGALMGFGFGSISSIKGMARSQVLNSQKGGLVKLSGNVAELKTVAELSNNEEIKAAAEKLTETSKPSEIGYVYNSLVADAVEQSVKEMTPVLLENGAKESGSNSAKGWATQIANSVFENNEGQKAALQTNAVTSAVYNEFVKEGKYGGDTVLALADLAKNTQPKAITSADVVDEQNATTPITEDGTLAMGPATSGENGETHPVTEAFGKSVKENLEKDRPNKKVIIEKLKERMPQKSRITPEGESIIKNFAKARGLKVIFTDNLVDDVGNGKYNSDTKTLYISRYSINPIKIVIKHEFTHSVETSKFFDKFKDYCFTESEVFKDWLKEKGFDKYSQAVNYELEKYNTFAPNTKDKSLKAENEVIANFVSETLFNKDGTDFNDEITTDFLKELSKNNRNLFQRFVDFVKNFIKRTFTGNSQKREINKLEQKFIRLVETVDTAETKNDTAEQGETEETETKQEAINEQTNKVGVEYNSETESVSQYSLASWENSDYVKDRNVAAQQIADAIGVSKKTAIKYINSINGIAKAIAEDKERLDYVAAVGRSAFVSNAEYGGSIDTSTLCQKRRWLTGTFSAIQKELKNSALTASEVLKIRNMLKDKGIEVSCGLCYVEGSRAEMGVFAKQFIERYKKTNPKYVPNMAEINTPEGIEEIRMKRPEVYEAYERFWNNKGVLNEGDSVLFASQRKPKLYSVRTDYKHEILDKFKNEDNVSAKNDNGGLRIQSFSDFEVVHLIDMMQVIMDMSRVGLAGQAYTKVPEFALALGDTGLKINLSLIAKDVDANGNLVFDNVEGMNIDTAMRIRDMYSKNVGTILVVFNDAQLKAALNDSRVDFIIPFHRSQWKRSQYAEIGLPANTKDYTYMQNERYIKPVYYTTRKGTQGKKKPPTICQVSIGITTKAAKRMPRLIWKSVLKKTKDLNFINCLWIIKMVRIRFNPMGLQTVIGSCLLISKCTITTVKEVLKHLLSPFSIWKKV